MLITLHTTEELDWVTNNGRCYSKDSLASYNKLPVCDGGGASRKFNLKLSCIRFFSTTPIVI